MLKTSAYIEGGWHENSGIDRDVSGREGIFDCCVAAMVGVKAERERKRVTKGGEVSESQPK